MAHVDGALHDEQLIEAIQARLPNGTIPLQVTWTRRTIDDPVDIADAVVVAAAAAERLPAGAGAV
jgi:hypothetical protein